MQVQPQQANLLLRKDLPLWQLIFMECYTVWQFGVIYFSDTSLSLLGRTPLPIQPENSTVFMLAGALASIVLLVLWQKRAAVVLRIASPVALLAGILLFFPLPDELLCAALYTQMFLCMLLFGFCHAMIILLLSDRSAVKQAIIDAILPSACMLLLYNEWFSLPFEVYNAIGVLSLGCFCYVSTKLPDGRELRFEQKQPERPAPVVLLIGLLAWVFIATFVMEMGLCVAENTPHGLFTLYLCAIPGGLLFFLLWRKKPDAPLKLMPLYIGVACIGFILAAISGDYAPLPLVACGLIGFSLIVFSLVAYIGQWVFKMYASRWILPLFVGMILLAMLAHTLVLDTLRALPGVLYTVYGAAAAILLLIYLLLEPYLLYRRRESQPAMPKPAPAKEVPTVLATEPMLFPALTARENEVARLILNGYTTSSIAAQLFISQNTVGSHRKEIYRKLDIHSKRELFALAAQKPVTEDA